MPKGLSNSVYGSIVPRLDEDYDRGQIDAVDVYEYKTEDGVTTYLDEDSFKEGVQADRAKLKILLDEIHNADKADLDFSPDEIHDADTTDLDSLLDKIHNMATDLPAFGLEYGDLVYAETDDEDSIIAGYDSASEKRKAKERKKAERILKKQALFEKLQGVRTNLVRAAVITGVVLGLTAASKSSLDLGSVNYDGHHISIEKETEVATNRSEKLIEGSITSKIVKKAKERLGVIKLENTKLASTSMNEGPSVNTNKLKCDSYKAHYAAILDDSNNLIDVIDVSKKKKMSINKFKKSCKKVYGNNISIQLNVDGVIDGKVLYEKAGWVSIEKSVSYNKKPSAKRI